MLFDPEMNIAEIKENLVFLEALDLVDHGDRDIKRVRVQPQTKLGRRLLDEKVVDRLNIDTLAYPYNFKDPIIQQIADEYDTWEKTVKEQLYRLQALTRGEAFKQRDQTKYTKLLGRFRRLDFEYLKALVLEAEMRSEAITNNLMEKTCKRKELLAELDSLVFGVNTLTIEPLTC